jgi:hypothetical protein
MSGQALDLRRSAQIARRRKVLVGMVLIRGLLVGSAYAYFTRPEQTADLLAVAGAHSACWAGSPKQRPPAPRSLAFGYESPLRVVA